MVATGVYAGLYGEDGGGIAQRVFAIIFFAWIAVLAVRALALAEVRSNVGGAD